jgi:hypothetical protein
MGIGTVRIRLMEPAGAEAVATPIVAAFAARPVVLEPPPSSGVERMSLGTRLALPSNRALFAGRGFREIAYHAHPGYPSPTWREMEKRLA